jgi:hypothetical protein
LIGKSKGKRTRGRPRRRFEESIKMDPREIRKQGVDCINLVQDRDTWRAFMNRVINEIHKIRGIC